jgi:hypothetical protein
MQMKNIQMRTTPLLFSLHFSRFVLFFSYGARNTKLGGQRHPTVWLFLCPFAEVKTLFACGFLLYLHLLDAGCA